jgi:hypothetical protein
MPGNRLRSPRLTGNDQSDISLLAIFQMSMHDGFWNRSRRQTPCWPNAQQMEEE